MKSIAWNHLGNVADAEDAVQETFLKMHRAATTYTGEASFSTWVFRILVNTCYDVLRKRKRRIEEAPIDDTLETAERTAPSVDDAKRMTLRKLLDELPEQRRTRLHALRDRRTLATPRSARSSASAKATRNGSSSRRRRSCRQSGNEHR